MAYRFNESSRCCATCTYWMGDRSIDYAKTVEVQTNKMNGKCAKGVFCSNSAGPDATKPACNKYELYPALK